MMGSPGGRSSFSVALCLLALGAALHARPLSAQDSLPHNDTLHLTLSTLLDSVQASHPAIQQSTHLTLAAHARRNALGRILESPQIEVQHAAQNAWQIYALQPFPWPWQISAKKRFGDADVAVAHAEEQARTDSVALDAAQRFADALRGRAELALATQAESLARAAVERAVAARQLGQAGDLALLQARVSLDAARRERNTAFEQSRLAVANLAIVLGVEPDAPIVVEGDLGTLAPVVEPDSGFYAQAAGSDPELNRYDALLLRAQREASMWRAYGRIPGIAIGPTYGWAINNRTPGTPRVSYFGLDFTLDIPIWHGRHAEVEAALEEGASAEQGHLARERELSMVLLDATSTMSRTERQLASLRGGELARAAQAESLAAGAMRQGGPYLAVWLAAREALLDAQRAALDLTWQAARARLTLQYLTGQLLQKPDSEGKGNGP